MNDESAAEQKPLLFPPLLVRNQIDDFLSFDEELILKHVLPVSFRGQFDVSEVTAGEIFLGG